MIILYIVVFIWLNVTAIAVDICLPNGIFETVVDLCRVVKENYQKYRSVEKMHSNIIQ
jgi:hypothetical protein